MTRTILRIALPVVAIASWIAACTLPTPVAAGPFDFLKGRRSRPQRVERTAAEMLADAIDDLEEELNEDGTVVAKAPDVWGEARLMKHRQEFERQLAKELENFDLHLNAAITRTDRAFLANALAISAALGGRQEETIAPDGTRSAQTPGTAAANVTVNQQPSLAAGPDKNVTTNIALTVPALTADFKQSTFQDSRISLEPTIRLDQLKRYIDHLHQIRRVNEGADTADAPGYALQLVRIPVSLMPGEKTRCGHGAEITVTAEPIVSRKLLPHLFRRIVMKDLTRAMSGPLGAALNNKALRRKVVALAIARDRFATNSEFTNLGGLMEEVVRTKPEGRHTWDWDRKEHWQRSGSPMRDEGPTARPILPIRHTQAAKQGDRLLKSFGDLFWNSEDHLPAFAKSMHALTAQLVGSTEISFDVFEDSRIVGKSCGMIPIAQFSRVYGRSELMMVGLEALDRTIGRPEYDALALTDGLDSPTTRAEFDSVVAEIERRIDQRLLLAQARAAGHEIPTPSGEDMPMRREDPDGEERREARRVMRATPSPEDPLVLYLADSVHPSIAEKYIETQLQHAYRLLLLPENRDLWKYADQNLVNAVYNVKRRGFLGLDELRDAFFRDLAARGQAVWYEYENTGTFAWAILVHATLLNERINEDAQRMAADRDCGCLDTYTKHAFHHPDPAPHAATAFADYVKCKWPVRVFALDPVAQEQNVLDQFSMRRELQLAMALAFASGAANISNATRFIRQFELDMETVALNRTAVAFGHGEDTFGWRFHPRVQTPDEEGNATVVFRDLLLGRQGKDARLDQHRIEPGSRECVALVVMPAFVPYVRFDVRGNWFQLTDPDDTRTSISDNVRMSRKIGAMRHLEECVCAEAELYHSPNLLRQLRARVRQIERKLPLQTVDAQMPLENLPCGATLFANGSADLSPELHYWTGAQGINTGKETNLLLKGANFSVLDTRVLVGDVQLPAENVDLVSREIMSITVPAGVRTKLYRKSVLGEGVDVHVATPYGITTKLFVPVHGSTQAPTPTRGFEWEPTALKAVYRFQPPKAGEDVELAGKIGGGVDRAGLRLTVPAGMRPSAKRNMTFRFSVSLDASTPPFGLATHEEAVSDIVFDQAANAYVLSLKDLATLHRGIRARVQSALEARFADLPDDADAAAIDQRRKELKDLTIRVDIWGTPDNDTVLPVTNSVTMLVKLIEEAQPNP